MKTSLGDALSQIGVLSSVDLLDVTYCDDLIICSDSEVWTYVVIAGENFGITTSASSNSMQKTSTPSLRKSPTCLSICA